LSTTNQRSAADRSARAGVFYGIAAYGAWGFAPVYFKAVAHVPAFEVLAHRVAWSFCLLTTLLVVTRRFRSVLVAFTCRRTIVTLLATTVLIAINWFVFIWSVANGYIVYASLGYFINPIVNVIFGVVLLKERLRLAQKISVALATVGVILQAVMHERLPLVGLLIALVLATSFGCYGLLRKTARVDAVTGLTVETTLLAPVSVGYLVYLAIKGTGTFGAGSLGMDGLLVAAGAVTAVPLLWFTNAARRLRLATLGFLQYLAPTGHFLLAVLVYHEAFQTTDLAGFGCIWGALLIYSVDTVVSQRRAVERRGSCCGDSICTE